MARIDSFLRLVVEQRASDLHLHSGMSPTIRFNGELLPLPFRALSAAETKRLLGEILDEVQLASLEHQLDLDFLYLLDGVARFRANAFHQNNGLGAVFRVVRPEPPTFDELLLPPVLRRVTQLNNGLVLVTGPTGAGKTTTVAALVNEINRNARRHIVTVEDPIEYIHKPLASVISQRQVEKHTESFASALRSALREAPDVLVVGELRDQETVSLALSAAETGILVIGTLHTNSASKTVDRLIDIMPVDSREQVRSVVASLLRCVVAQHLCRRASGEGMVAVMEVLIQSWATITMIREAKTHQLDSYLQLAANQATGSLSLDDCIASHVRNGYVSLDDGLKVASNPHRVRELVGTATDE
ncbi:MAG: PilT/PilU family type 4a pilus ATPase [Myxococcales bacterium]|nr:PilT/PilU family type 4a pilus ATPase [Myxococcales bacterium]